MFWICYDLFVWNKTVFEVNVSSYVGSVMSLACLWIGTLIWKRKGSRKQYLQEDILLDKKDNIGLRHVLHCSKKEKGRVSVT